MKRLLAVAVIGTMTGTAGLTGCETNPTTGKSQFQALSRQQELQIGQEAAPQLTSEMGGAVADPVLQAYVAEVGQRLVAQTEGDAPQRQWDFTLLDSDVINAFALPGEKVFISRGLAAQLENEAQLAAVLGHEIGHVTARHVNDRIADQMWVGGAGALLGLVVGEVTDSDAVRQVAPVAFGLGGQVILLRFSRGQETEADSLGMRYMARAGYDPYGALGVMQVLARESQRRGGLELLATHPYPETRIENIQRLLRTEYAFTQGNPNFMLNGDRYQQRFLSRLGALPRREPGAFELALARLGPASGWCAHCAEAAGPDGAAAAHR